MSDPEERISGRHEDTGDDAWSTTSVMRTFRQRSAYGSIMPVQLRQSALWAAHIQRMFDGYVERARNTFASSPDRGDA